MGQVIWTYFATFELKNIYLYYKMATSVVIAEKIKRSILNATKNYQSNLLWGKLKKISFN
jgi:hypothetical protein